MGGQEPELVDITVTPEAEENKPARGRLIAGGLAVVAAIAVGGFVVASQGGEATEVAVAETGDDEESTASEPDISRDTTDEVTDAVVDATEASAVDPRPCPRSS